MIKEAALETIRAWEIQRVALWFEKGVRVLEIGAGTGQQAAELAKQGFCVEGIEIRDSLYASTRIFPVTVYDGITIPFPDGSFDVVYSSNVLEHVQSLTGMHAEIKRVLKKDGRVVHVLPTHWWRFWTTLMEFPVALVNLCDCSSARDLAVRLLAPLRQRRHGERGNVLSEIWYFHPRWWRREFLTHGFGIVHETPMGLFYTGHQLAGENLSLTARARISAFLGSACHLYVLSVGPPSSNSKH